MNMCSRMYIFFLSITYFLPIDRIVDKNKKNSEVLQMGKKIALFSLMIIPNLLSKLALNALGMKI